jgi:hypothetical protein
MRLPSSWRAAKYPSAIRSVSVSKTSTGTSMSVRRNDGVGASIAGCGSCDNGAAPPPRLCTRNASYTCATGCTAFTYVTMRNADCDSPIAITRRGRSFPSGGTPPDSRSTCATWENMSYEKLSPGWTRGA